MAVTPLEEGVTADGIERCLDRLAVHMTRMKSKAPELMQIYERLEMELPAYRARDGFMTSVMRRSQRVLEGKARRPSS